MCVVSMVSDHYGKRWPFNEPYVSPPEPFTPTVPFSPGIGIPAQPYQGIPNSPWQQIQPSDVDKMRQILKEFREAMDAAKKVDVLTKQPDCEDMGKKALLEARVSELERRLDALTPKAKAKSRRKQKP